MSVTSSPAANNRFAWLFALTIFLSAFLLFQVQPIISRMILPWFGGGSAVWTTCLMFFQVALLGGYAYAHFLSSTVSPKRQMQIHIVLLIAAACTLPIMPGEEWKPIDGAQPSFRILVLLFAKIGLPYFMLASTGPLLTAWFNRVYPGRLPFRLYALSNIGSLLALLSYPFVFEPWLTSNGQGWFWTTGFGLFAVLCAGLAYVAAMTTTHNVSPAKPEINVKKEKADAPSLLKQRLAWVVLPMLSSVTLLAVTAHLCQDVAVIPFFWILPLSLYLLSFILCFDAEAWYHRRFFSIMFGFFLLWICLVELSSEINEAVNSSIHWINQNTDIATINYEVLLEKAYFSGYAGFLNSVFDKLGLSLRVGVSEYAGESFVYLAMLFCLCMICHGELVRLKPASQRLTEFYLMMSTGGALGGIFVALICPQVFNFNFEMRLSFVAGYLLAVFVLSDSLRQTIWFNRFWKRRVALAGCVFLLMFVVWAQFKTYDAEAILLKRNFYGILKVKDFGVGGTDHIREFLHGRILHGSQFQDSIRRKMPTTYFVRESGIGIALNHICKSDEPARIAVVGLGAGTLATYGRPGDYYCFYEINPDVIEIAQKYFSYLRDSPAKTHLELGDARIRMERQQAQKYDLIALDAFTGDAIPVHLLTEEAFEGYFRHLRDPNRGIIAVQATNTYVDLLPVAHQLASRFQLQAKLVTSYFNDWELVRSDWVLMTRNTDFLTSPSMREHGQDISQLAPKKKFRLWTDQYSNLFQILK